MIHLIVLAAFLTLSPTANSMRVHASEHFLENYGHTPPSGSEALDRSHQQKLNCGQKVANASLRLSFEQDQDNELIINEGSGTVVSIPPGYSVPAGTYILTARHVLSSSESEIYDGREIASSPLESSFTATSLGNKNSKIARGQSYCASKENGSGRRGEAMLVAVNSQTLGSLGVTPCEIENSLPRAKDGEKLTGFGFEDGTTFNAYESSQSDKKFLKGEAVLSTEGKNKLIPGQSGGLVVAQNEDGSCSPRGVNSYSSEGIAGISTIRNLLMNPQDCE